MCEPLRILFVCHNQTRKGGAYYRGLNLGVPLARRGHDVTLMAIHPSERLSVVESEIDGLRVVESPDLLWGSGRSGWDPWDTLKRTLWIRERRFDIIHTVDTRPAVSLPAIFARRASKSAWVADWTDWWGRGGATTERDGRLMKMLIGPLEQFFEEKPRPYADGTVVISHALGKRAEGLGINGADILYLPPGADSESIRTTSMAAARSKMGLDAGRRYIGYLGNIYQRDADLLFETLSRLKTDDTHLLMVGDPGCGIPESISDRVSVTGRVPFNSMLDYLSACEVLVLPLSDTIANRGRWPSKINEYVAVGRPIVACEVGDVANLLRENEIGLLVAPNATDFALSIDELLDDTARAEAMGKTAREIAKTTYSQKAIADKLEKFYKKIIVAKATGN